MSRSRIFTIILVLLTFLTSCTLVKGNAPKVLFILEEKSPNLYFGLKNEVGAMAQMLDKAGYKVVYASNSGESLGFDDVIINPDLKLKDVNINDYVGIIVPCLGIGVDRPFDPEANRIIVEALAAGKPVAAASGGIFSLQNAGVLGGKQYAASRVDARFLYGGTNMGEGVVQDGNLITSANCPAGEAMGIGKDETRELTQKFIDALASAS